MTPVNRWIWRSAFVFFVFYAIVQLIRGRYIGAVIQLGFISIVTVCLIQDWRARRAERHS
jgi:hypothetical protein